MRVSTRQQSNNRKAVKILAAGSRRDGLCVNHGITDAGASRAHLERALNTPRAGNTLVITTVERLGRSTQNILPFAKDLRRCGVGLRVLNLGGLPRIITHSPIRNTRLLLG